MARVGGPTPHHFSLLYYHARLTCAVFFVVFSHLGLTSNFRTWGSLDSASDSSPIPDRYNFPISPTRNATQPSLPMFPRATTSELPFASMEPLSRAVSEAASQNLDRSSLPPTQTRTFNPATRMFYRLPQRPSIRRIRKSRSLTSSRMRRASDYRRSSILRLQRRKLA